jgi:predicted RNase H-like HicB family nuclease
MSRARVAALKVDSGQLSVTAAAAECGFSCRHLHRLLVRYREGGLEALEPRSRAPRTNPAQTSAEIRQRPRPSPARPSAPARMTQPSRVHDCGGSTVSHVTALLQLTIVFEDGDDGWIVASIPEVPGAHSQGRTREEARENVIDALKGILELRFRDHGSLGPGVDSESLELVIAA